MMKSDIVTNDLYFLRIDDAGHTNNNFNSITTTPRTNSLPLNHKQRDRYLAQENGHLLNTKTNDCYYSTNSTNRQRKTPIKLPPHNSSSSAVHETHLVDLDHAQVNCTNSPLRSLVGVRHEDNSKTPSAHTSLWMSTSSPFSHSQSHPHTPNHTNHQSPTRKTPTRSTQPPSQSPSRSPWSNRAASYTCSSPNNTLPYSNHRQGKTLSQTLQTPNSCSPPKHTLLSQHSPIMRRHQDNMNNMHAAAGATHAKSTTCNTLLHSAIHGGVNSFNDFNFNNLDRERDSLLGDRTGGSDRDRSPTRGVRKQKGAMEQLFVDTKENYGSTGVTLQQVTMSSHNRDDKNMCIDANQGGNSSYISNANWSNNTNHNNDYKLNHQNVGVADFGLPPGGATGCSGTGSISGPPRTQSPPKPPTSPPCSSVSSSRQSGQPLVTSSHLSGQQQQQQIAIRVALFGYQGVGKSSIILQFIRNRFRRQYIPTIEDTYQKEIDTQIGPKTIRVTDTNGSFQFPAMQRKTIHQSHVILLVFSITSRQSFDFLSRVHDDICRCGKQPPKPIILVGNKCDEHSNRQVTQAQALAHANNWGCPYVETSAKDNINIQDVFLGAARLSFEDSPSSQQQRNNVNHQNNLSSSSRRRERLKQQQHQGGTHGEDTNRGCCRICCCIS